MGMPAGEQFARAVAAKDSAALLELLAPQIDFQAMTPRKVWESGSAAEVVNDIVFGRWFASTDRIESIEELENDVVGNRERVGYRFRVTNDDGEFLVEQQAYLDVENDKVTWMRILCAGYQPVTPR